MYSIESIERFEKLKLVRVRRNRRGVIVHAQFEGDLRQPVRPRLKAGTRYSYHSSAVSRKVWEFKPLPSGVTEDAPAELAELEVRDG
jgi:hypothetical protein